MAPDAHARLPDLFAAYHLTLLSVAPELWNGFPVPEAIARSFAFTREGNPSSWTRRLAHGVAEFLLGYAERTGESRASIAFHHVDHADPSDQEFISILVCRADSRLLQVRVVTASRSVDPRLVAALAAHARLIDRAVPVRVRGRHGPVGANTVALATEHVESDCTSARGSQAYAQLSVEDRRALHAARLSSLTAVGEPSLAMGAIPFHAEQALGDAAPLLAAAAACMRMAYYHAALDWALRGRRLIDPAWQGRTYGELTRQMLFALLLLDRIDEVDVLCDECLARSVDPVLLTHVSYAKAILLARYYPPSRRDYTAAGAWIVKSQAFTAMVPTSGIRATNLAFLENTMALVDIRTGHPDTAIGRLTAALESLARDAPDGFATECEIFLHNRAKVHVAINQLDDAVADLTCLLQHEPSNSSALLDRGVLNQRMGRLEDAARDYEASILWSPPYEEAHFNRGVVLEALGRTEEAIAEFDYVLTLNPTFAEALIQRARLRHHRRDFDAAARDVDRALSLSPADARALCLRGLVETARGQFEAADGSFTEALEHDPRLPDAWANRATIRFRQGSTQAALDDLTQAVALRPDADTLYNRGRVLASIGHWQDAIDDYGRALALPRADEPLIRRHLAACRRALAEAAAGPESAAYDS